MNRLLARAGITAAITLGSLALTAGARAQLAPEPTVSNALWSGFYMGVNGGADISDSSTVVNTALTFENSFALSRVGQTYGPTAVQGASGKTSVGGTQFLGGGQIGFNIPIGQSWLTGIEADIDGESGRSSTAINQTIVRSGFEPNAVQTSLATRRQLEFLSTVRGRFGFMVQPSLWLYATGGLAIGGATSSTTLTATEVPNTGSTDVNASGAATKTLTGYTAGIGTEWLIGQKWSLKAEYLYYHLGTLTYSNTPYTAFLNGTSTVDFSANSTSSTRFRGNIVRVGLNYHF